MFDDLQLISLAFIQANSVECFDIRKKVFGSFNEAFRIRFPVFMKLACEEEVSPIIVFGSVLRRMAMVFKEGSQRIEVVEAEQIPIYLFFQAFRFYVIIHFYP